MPVCWRPSHFWSQFEQCGSNPVLSYTANYCDLNAMTNVGTAFSLAGTRTQVSVTILIYQLFIILIKFDSVQWGLTRRLSNLTICENNSLLMTLSIFFFLHQECGCALLIDLTEEWHHAVSGPVSPADLIATLQLYHDGALHRYVTSTRRSALLRYVTSKLRSAQVCYVHGGALHNMLRLYWCFAQEWRLRWCSANECYIYAGALHMNVTSAQECLSMLALWTWMLPLGHTFRILLLRRTILCDGSDHIYFMIISI